MTWPFYIQRDGITRCSKCACVTGTSWREKARHSTAHAVANGLAGRTS